MKKYIKRLFALLAALCLAGSLAACGSPKSYTADIFAMDTVMKLTAYGPSAETAVNAAAKEINRLEAQLSNTIATSEISQLNAGSGGTVSEETASLLSAALTYAQMTDGAFDMTIAPVVAAWGITTDNPQVPTQAEIDALLPLVGSGHVSLSGTAVTLDAGCSVDLGGIAKGYASDRIAAVFKENGVTSGVISLGGNVYACGMKSKKEGWRVAIQDPQNSAGYAALVTLSDQFAVTSGGYQRYFTGEDGTVYQHIIDPATGYPVQGDLTSVTIIGTNGTMCDAYSTALYVMGLDKATAYWRSHSDDFDMVLITADGRVLYTPGLADNLESVEGSSYAYAAIG